MANSKQKKLGLVSELTSREIVTLADYRNRWLQDDDVSSQNISHQEIEKTCNLVYGLLGKNEPKIVFCRSPKEAISQYFFDYIDAEWYRCKPLSAESFSRRIKKTIGTGQGNRVRQLVANAVSKQLDRQVSPTLFKKHNGDYVIAISDFIANQVHSSLGQLHPGGHVAPIKYDAIMDQLGHNCLSSDLWIPRAAWLDFCMSELGCRVETSRWSVFSRFVSNLKYRVLFLFSNVCFVCDYPQTLSVDEQGQLHGDGKPAVEYADELKLYAHHGIPIPDKYGSVLSELWQPQWLLSERNVEIRRALVQGIGYERICHELDAKIIDQWREYQLLSIDGITDTMKSLWTKEPIHMLKMVCPSTRFIHILRVPPEIMQARDAIRWVNHGIDPEAFGQET